MRGILRSFSALSTFQEEIEDDRPTAKSTEAAEQFREGLQQAGVTDIEMNGVPIHIADDGERYAAPEESSARVILNDDEFDRLEQEGRDAEGDPAALARFYDRLVEHGSAESESEDNHRWHMAFLASLVGKSYGKDALGQYATDVDESAKRLREWRQVYLYFSREFIDHYRAAYPIFRYTHFRLAMRLGRKADDFKVAEDFLIECGVNDWRVTKAEFEADARTEGGGSKMITEGTADVLSVEGDLVTIRLNNDEIVKAFAGRTGGQFKLRLYEPEV